MKILTLGLMMMLQSSLSYYQNQFDQVSPLQPTRDVCVGMIPPYIGKKPFRNWAPMQVQVESQWISHKRVSIAAFSPFDRYQAFSGMMVQITKDNLPFGEFEVDEKTEVTDCDPGQRNLALVRSSYKLLTAAVNWVSPPNFDVYTEQLSCIVTIIALNQKYWTVQFPIVAAPHTYPGAWVWVPRSLYQLPLPATPQGCWGATGGFSGLDYPNITSSLKKHSE